MPAQKGGDRGAVARSAVNDIRIGALAVDVDEQCTVRKLFAYPCNVTTDRLMIVVIKGTCRGRFISCIRRAVGVDVAAAEEGGDKIGGRTQIAFDVFSQRLRHFDGAGVGDCSAALTKWHCGWCTVSAVRCGDQHRQPALAGQNQCVAISRKPCAAHEGEQQRQYQAGEDGCVWYGNIAWRHD